jgi:hypothetical protein
LAYSRSPATLIADTMGGTCSWGPRKPAMAARRPASSTREASAVAVTVPAASRVSVSAPKAILAR